MLHLIVHLHIRPGREEAFRSYEHRALAIFREHGGRVIGAFRPESRTEETPFEIHVLSLPSEEAWAAFRGDPRIAAMAEDRQDAIRRTDLFISRETVPY